MKKEIYEKNKSFKLGSCVTIFLIETFEHKAISEKHTRDPKIIYNNLIPYQTNLKSQSRRLYYDDKRYILEILPLVGLIRRTIADLMPK